MGCQLCPDESLLQADTVATDGEDRRPSGDSVILSQLPGFGGGGEIAHGDRIFRTPVPKRRSGAEKKEPAAAEYELGSTRSPLGSSHCRDGGGRSFVKRAVSDSAQPETDRGPPMRLNARCPEIAMRSAKRPIRKRLSMYRREEEESTSAMRKGNTSDRISLRSAPIRAGSGSRRGLHRGNTNSPRD